MARSGSTVQYQMVCEIIESLGLGMTMGWVQVPNKELLDNLENAAFRKDKFLALKSHDFSPQIKTLVDNAIAKLSHQLNNYYLWTSLENIMISQYENMVVDLYSEVLKIANYLEVEVNNDLARSISNKLEINQQKQKVKKLDYDPDVIKSSGNDLYDPVSQLHNNHINSGKWGQWKESLSKEQIQFIESWAFSWLMERGYPLSTFKNENCLIQLPRPF
ncbi:sulfotransferase domain-containing protein [Limnospira sp. PMC 1298.21]|nr:sulfotransferase domain-containing protein [Limnospira sp. PMC 1298.21]